MPYIDVNKVLWEFRVERDGIHVKREDEIDFMEEVK